MNNRFLIQELFGINNKQYKLLRKSLSQDAIMRTHQRFNQEKRFQQISVVHLFYYIDEVGDFVENGKQLPHYRVARAVYESMDAHDKVCILTYIEENRNGQAMQ